MLDEQEWEQISPMLDNEIVEIQEYRRLHGASLAEAKNHVHGDRAVQRYYELTGSRVRDAQTIWHHRVSRFGPPCSSCGKLLRTPNAKFCAECSAPVNR